LSPFKNNNQKKKNFRDSDSMESSESLSGMLPNKKEDNRFKKLISKI